VAAGLLAAVGRARGQAGVAAAADLLLPVELLGEGNQGWLHDATTEAEHKVQGGLLLDVVVSQGAALLQLLAGEDQALLIRGDALLVLDLGLHVLNRVRGLDLEGDGLAGKGLDEDLHSLSVFKTKNEQIINPYGNGNTACQTEETSVYILGATNEK
jgi:hypothetical protein